MTAIYLFAALLFVALALPYEFMGGFPPSHLPRWKCDCDDCRKDFF